MITEYEPYIVAIMYFTIGTVGAVINITIFISIVKAKLLTTGDPLYILSTFAIVDPTVRLLFVAYSWGPLCVYKYDFMSKTLVELQAFFALVFFMQFSLIQVLIALNRYLTVKNSRLADIFTRKFYVYTVLLLLPSITAIVSIAYATMPCCKLTFNPSKYLLEYEQNGQINYFNLCLFIPWSTIAIIIPVSCYIQIFRITRQKVFQQTDYFKQKKGPRILEYNVVFIFYTVFFLGFEFLIYFPDIEFNFLHAIAMAFGCMDAISISMIQAIMNKRIRDSVTNILQHPKKIFSTAVSNSSIAVRTIINNNNKQASQTNQQQSIVL